MTTEPRIYQICRHADDRHVWRFIATCKDDQSDGYLVVTKEMNFELAGGVLQPPEEFSDTDQFPTLEKAQAKADASLRGHLDDGWKKSENSFNGALA